MRILVTQKPEVPAYFVLFLESVISVLFSRQQVRLHEITGRYGITCGQVLAAACAVMDGG